MQWEDETHKIYPQRRNKTYCVIFYDNSATPETRTHNNVNELTARDATNLTYDDNGNLTDDGIYTYAYDALNRLIKVTRKSDSAVMGEYAYDALNRRIWRKSDEDQSGSQETELYYVHDGNREIEERVYSDEDLKRDYVYGNYIDEPIFGRSDNNDDNDFADSKEQFYYCHNNLYNVAVLLDPSGNIIESYAYKPYGKPTIYTSDGGDGDWFDGDETTGPLTGNYYLFTGRSYDPESEQYYYRARPYRPDLGRFPSRDPQEGLDVITGIPKKYINGMNLYIYCFDNPVNYTDPSGLISCVACEKIRRMVEPMRQQDMGKCGITELTPTGIAIVTVGVLVKRPEVVIAGAALTGYDLYKWEKCVTEVNKRYETANKWIQDCFKRCCPE